MRRTPPIDITAQHRLPDGPRKGRVLRVKRGYNPNSSSMGSMVFVLPAALLGLTAAFGAVAGLIFSAFTRRNRRREPHPDEAPEDGPAMKEPR